MVLPNSDRAFVVFHVGGTLGALPLEGVEKIAPMAELAKPPGLPAPLEGILNWGGTSVPVLRLDHLLNLPEKAPALYSMLLLAKLVPARSDSPVRSGNNYVAMLVDRVREVIVVPSSSVLPAGRLDCFNACVQGTIQHRQDLIHVLSPERILLEKERESLAVFLGRERSRLNQWENTLQ